MKKILITLITLLTALSSYAQAPQKMSFQAVIRNTNGTLVTNLGVGMRVSIIQGSATGNPVYTEVFNPNPITNANGLVTMEIGGGIPLVGNFSNINWANGPYFVFIETDPAGGTNYSITSSSQLMSVPYALFSGSSNGTNGKNSLIRTTTETAGSNCAAGGVKQEYGLDSNNNGTLDDNEINLPLTKYVCNGVSANTNLTVLTNEGITLSQGKFTCGGTIISDGVNTITERGIVWSKSNTAPTISDNKIKNGSGIGGFSAIINSASFMFKYYIRAYAVTSSGTVYGNVITYSPTPIIATFATTGIPTPYSANLTIDASGNVYVADWANHRILKYTSSGSMSVFAGDGTSGLVNANGTSARFSNPLGLAIDASGNLYVSEAGNNTIRKITPSGNVSTLAGGGTSGNQSGDLDGTGTAALFSNPAGLSIDASNNIYVCDRYNHKIKKISPTGVVTTIAGSTAGNQDGTGNSAKMERPSAIIFDAASGDFYFGDFWNCKLRKVSAAGVVTSPFSNQCGYQDGNGTIAKFNSTMGMGYDTYGNLFVNDFFGGRVRKVEPNLDVTSLIGKGYEGDINGDPETAVIHYPSGMAIDATNGIIYIVTYEGKIKIIK